MKKYLFIPLFSIIVNSSFSQENDTNLKQLKLLVDEVNTLKRQLSKIDSTEHDKVKKMIFLAIQNGPTLKVDFEKTKKYIESTKVFTKLASVNNPQNKMFGASFIDIVQKAAVTHLTSDLAPNEKSTFMQIVDKIVNNPFVKSFISSNPAASIVASVTNAAATYFNNKPVLGKNNKLENLSIKSEYPIDEKKIEAFNNAIAPYIKFYDMLLQSNQNYLQNIEILTKKYKFLEGDIRKFNFDLSQSLGINLADNTIPYYLTVAQIFEPEKENGVLHYQQVLNDERIIEAYKISSNYATVLSLFNSFKFEYNEILQDYLSTNMTILTTYKQDPSLKDLDKNKFEELTNDIALLMNDLNPDQKKDGSLPAIKKNFKNINIDAFNTLIVK
ncbi:hypothetical protein [Sphingobacterium detergens]|uniref:hypothetical protein n=1 Tax=Sphingobacterium detergens TaxID=1145106 RepID=UPI003AAD046B